MRTRSLHTIQNGLFGRQKVHLLSFLSLLITIVGGTCGALASDITKHVQIAQNSYAGKDMAYEMFGPMAERGDAKAQFRLGGVYERQGHIDKAKYWYNRAAAQGLGMAQNALSRLNADNVSNKKTEATRIQSNSKLNTASVERARAGHTKDYSQYTKPFSEMTRQEKIDIVSLFSMPDKELDSLSSSIRKKDARAIRKNFLLFMDELQRERKDAKATTIHNIQATFNAGEAQEIIRIEKKIFNTLNKVKSASLARDISALKMQGHESCEAKNSSSPTLNRVTSNKNNDALNLCAQLVDNDMTILGLEYSKQTLLKTADAIIHYAH